MSIDVKARSFSALLWGAGGTAFKMLIQIGTQIVLARQLGPEQYGIFAIGSIVVVFSGFLADFGIAYALIQKEEVVEDDLRFVFTWQIIIGAAIGSAILVASPSIAALFGDIRAAGVISALALVCFFNALAAPSLNLLKRALNWRRIQLATIVSYIVGYVICGIPLAFLGFQVWALVVAWIVQAGISGFLLYIAVKHPIRLLFWYSDASKQMSYGITVFMTNITNWCTNNIDRVIVGRAFGSLEVGYYSTAFNLLYNPTAAVLGVIQPVFFSASARLGSAKDAVAQSYSMIVAAVFLVFFPAMVTLAAVAPTLIHALYGSAWLPMSELVRPIALAMPIFVLWGISTPILWSVGRASQEFRLQLPMACLWLGASSVAAQYSVAAVAWTVYTLYLVRCMLVVRAALGVLNLGWLQIWLVTRGGIAMTVLVATAVTVLDHAASSAPSAVRLLADIAVGMFVWLVGIRFVPTLMDQSLNVALEYAASRLPPRIARWCMKLVPHLTGN
jgi:lipopolysaccharide exporter